MPDVENGLLPCCQAFKVRNMPFPVGEAIPWPDGLLED